MQQAAQSNLRPRSSTNVMNNDKSGSNFWVQAVVLLLLVLQTTSSCTVVSYSKGVLKEKYNPLEVVMCTEFIKLVAAGK